MGSADWKRLKAGYGQAEKKAEREQAQALISMLPKVKIVTQKEEYLASLDTEERRRFLLREYFQKIDNLRVRKRKPSEATNKEQLSWLVCQKPFPQLFMYQEGDDTLFANCIAVRFTRFLSAYKLYLHLLKTEVKTAMTNKSAGYFEQPRTRNKV
jgi:hypothetical protein